MLVTKCGKLGNGDEPHKTDDPGGRGGTELHSDAWERFERTVDKVVEDAPVHRTAKPVGEDRLQNGGARRPAKRSDWDASASGFENRFFITSP